VLASVLGEIVTGALSNGATVELDVPDDLAVVADRLVLDRVVSNLLINAVRYGAEPITLSAEAGATMLRISVEDSGEGISDELRPRLFERFARSDSPNVGSGLGLAIARTYARAHGGDLVYDPGERGARFELIIPQP
jgi:two-component system sensor histidine kinase MtrB